MFLTLYNEFSNVVVLLWSYMLIYNFSLVVLFATLFQVTNTDIKTTHSFSNFSNNNPLGKLITISLFSMAGVPPFLGFFSKLFIFILLANSSFFILFFVFFILLFSGLFFYVQNIRFLNSSKPSNHSPVFSPLIRVSYSYYNVILPITFFLITGVVFTEDLLLFISWIVL